MAIGSIRLIYTCNIMCDGGVPTLHNLLCYATIALLEWFDRYCWFSARMFDVIYFSSSVIKIHTYKTCIVEHKRICSMCKILEVFLSDRVTVIISPIKWTPLWFYMGYIYSPRPYLNGSLGKPLLKSGYGWVVISHFYAGVITYWSWVILMPD